MAGADTIERLRQFLRDVPSQARSKLIGELERSLLRVDDTAAGDLAAVHLVLQELRGIVREQREGGPRIGNAARLFFRPIEPFLVDDRGDHNHPGRIARSSLELLWTWVRRDLLPDDATILADDVGEALVAGDAAKADIVNRAFQDRAVAAIEVSFEAANTDDKLRRRLMAQIGTRRPDEDAAVLKCALKGRDTLAAVASHLPLRIGNLTGAMLDEYNSLIDSATKQDRELFLPALLVVMHRLAAPWQLIRFGVKAAGCDIAARVSETRYGVAVTVVLADLERMVGELAEELRSGRAVAVVALLKTIHDALRGLRTELDIPVDSSWGRSLAALRGQIADLLRSEIDAAPGRVRRLLRARPSTEIRPHSELDSGEIAETEALVGFVGACRSFANELAVNEVTQRAFLDLQQYLDGGTRALLDGLRHAGDSDRRFRQSQVDAAARFCAKIFGPDYGSILSRAAEVASAPERRPAYA